MPAAVTDLAERMRDLARSGIDLASNRISASPSPLWRGLAALGTRLWLDTGDISAAESLWTAEFSGLTTNNTLLNKEVQTGAYDAFVPQAAKLVTGLDERTTALEIAFALNARHGLRLVQRFGCEVSVELHTGLAHDVERSIAYGLRYHAVCPERFLVKLPFTPAGLIAARELGKRGVPINLTLGFSARHNLVATAAARPRFVNVFLGRLNAWAKDNRLGDGAAVGEKALIASQRVVTELDAGAKRTFQIAASVRSGAQLRDLAGCNVITIPTAAATEAKQLDGTWRDRTRDEFRPVFTSDPRATRSETLWDISPAERRFADELAARPPAEPGEIVARAHAAGCGDLFPKLSDADAAAIAKDGKIPKQERWAGRIASKELAPDTLLNLAGLASFTADQAALDDRVRKHMQG
jgi:transaldolase